MTEIDELIERMKDQQRKLEQYAMVMQIYGPVLAGASFMLMNPYIELSKAKEMHDKFTSDIKKKMNEALEQLL